MPKFITITDVFEQLIEGKVTDPKERLFLESFGKGVIKFNPDANVNIYVEETDIVTHNGYAAIMDQIIDVSEKVKLLEDLIIKIANEKITNCEINYGIKISCSLNFRDTILFRINLEDLIKKYESSNLD